MSEKQKIINFEKIFISERIRDLTETSDGKILLYTDGGSLILLSRI
jgi:glucose/arabinose dehydrogenase